MTAAKLNIVPFVSVDSMMKLVLAIGVERFLTELAGYIEEDFRRWELFDKTPRVASHSHDGVIELMPTSDGRLYGFKYVNGHPKNTREGLQTVTAFGVLADVGSGYPMLLTEMTILTALRTAATSALVAKYLAPKGARTMTIIGVTLVPEMAVAPTAALPDLRVVPFTEPMPSRTVALAWRRNGHRQAECKALAQVLKGVRAEPAHTP